jgi:hypothetical protein
MTDPAEQVEMGAHAPGGLSTSTNSPHVVRGATEVVACRPPHCWMNGQLRPRNSAHGTPWALARRLHCCRMFDS